MRTLRLTLFLALTLLITTVNAQVRPFTQENGDCTGAIYIPDSFYVNDQAVRGFGNVLEIKENPFEDKQWFEREHHTTWYKFRVPVACNLTFDIIPKDIRDDIDFLVFEGAILSICDNVINKQVVPLRSNISRNDTTIRSMCGLSKSATENYVRSGLGSSYSNSMKTEAGQLFYLVVDQSERPRAGYTIRFHYDPPPPPPEPEVDEKKKQALEIHVISAVNREPLMAKITIDGLKFDEVVEAKGRSSYSFELDFYRSLKIGCARKGYMFSTVRVKGNNEPINRVEIKLVPIAPGEQVILDDINFVGNESKVVRSAEASLVLLARFMQENPTVKIEIQGHLNGPTFKNKKEFIELSTSRAQAIFNYLLVNDIEPDRMTYLGYGNSAMIYPEPTNKEQSEANRRVEVKITGM